MGKHNVRLHIHVKSSFEEDNDVKVFQNTQQNSCVVRIYTRALILNFNACLHVLINQIGV